MCHVSFYLGIYVLHECINGYMDTMVSLCGYGFRLSLHHCAKRTCARIRGE